MPSPFPGMDPYLEDPPRWHGFHTNLIVKIQDALNDVLPKGFLAVAEERVYIDAPSRGVAPDVTVYATAPVRPPALSTVATATLPVGAQVPESIPVARVRERFVNVVELAEGEERIVASVEILSPSNKTPDGNGAREYRRKQARMADAGIHLLEVDLLRAGRYVLVPDEQRVRERGPWDYLVSLYDASASRCDVWRISLPGTLPVPLLPLREGVAPVPLDLQRVVNQTYDRSRLDERIDYRRDPPPPPLAAEDAQWVDALLREKGLR